MVLCACVRQLYARASRFHWVVSKTDGDTRLLFSEVSASVAPPSPCPPLTQAPPPPARTRLWLVRACEQAVPSLAGSSYGLRRCKCSAAPGGRPAETELLAGGETSKCLAPLLSGSARAAARIQERSGARGFHITKCGWRTVWHRDCGAWRATRWCFCGTPSTVRARAPCGQPPAEEARGVTPHLGARARALWLTLVAAPLGFGLGLGSRCHCDLKGRFYLKKISNPVVGHVTEHRQVHLRSSVPRNVRVRPPKGAHLEKYLIVSKLGSEPELKPFETQLRPEQFQPCHQLRHVQSSSGRCFFLIDSWMMAVLHLLINPSGLFAHEQLSLNLYIKE